MAENVVEEMVFPTRYVRIRRCLDAAVGWLACNRPKQVDRRWGVTTFVFDRLDDARLSLARRAAHRKDHR